jgi:hypothetical protein
MEDATGPGQLVGVPVKYGSLNDRGECFLKGAYAEAIEEFLQIGFNCDSHEWNYQGIIGFPIEAHETDDGLVSTFQFHSTDDAQNVRIKLQERIQHNKAIGLSQGFMYVDYFDIYPKQYASELPKYLREDQLAVLMAYAMQFPRIRIVRKAFIYEYSVVAAGSQEDAMATEVRSVEGIQKTSSALAQFRSEFLGENINGEMTISALLALMDALLFRVLYPLLVWTWSNEIDHTREEKLQILQGALDEFGKLFMNACDGLITDPELATEAGNEIRDIFGDPDKDETYNPSELRAYADSRLEIRLLDHSQAVLSAARGFMQRMERARSWRSQKRAGRELSEKNLTMLRDHRDAAQAIHDGLARMIEAVEAKSTDEPIAERTTDGGQLKQRLLARRLRSVTITD